MRRLVRRSSIRAPRLEFETTNDVEIELRIRFGIDDTHPWRSEGEEASRCPCHIAKTSRTSG